MLVASHNGERVEAKFADIGPDYRCPDCQKQLILKKGRIRIHHFAHKPKTTCVCSNGETLEHLKSKALFRDEFVSRGLIAEVEHVVPSLPNDKRADVLIWSPIGNRFAIELQHTAVDYDNLEERTKSYIRAKVAVIWIPFIKPEHLERAEPIALGQEGDFIIEKYPARPMEKWVHGLYFGEPWIYDPRSEVLYLYKLKPHLLHKEYTEWHDEEGEEQSAGGYDYRSRRWRNLFLWGPYRVDQVRIDVIERKKTKIGGHQYPGGPIGKLILDREI